MKIDEGKIEEIRLMIGKGRRSLIAAKKLFTEGDYETTSSRAYYAVFHTIQAILLTMDLTYSKHSGVIGGFFKHFIKTGIFPKEFARFIKQLRKDRETGDYEYHSTITREEAERDIQNAEKIIVTLEEYLSEEGYKLR